MRRTALALALVCGGLLVVTASSAEAQIPAWVDNNPANAPRMMYGCGTCGYGGCANGQCGYAPAPGYAPAGGHLHRGCVANLLRSCKARCLAHRWAKRGAADCCDGGCADGGCAAGGCAAGGCADGGCADGGCAAGGCADGGCANGGCANCTQ